MKANIKILTAAAAAVFVMGAASLTAFGEDIADVSSFEQTAAGEELLLAAEAELTDISDGTLTLAGESFTYSGNAVIPQVTVTLDEKELSLGTDYNIFYSDIIEAGTASVTVTGTGDYCGELSASYTIAPAPLSDFVLSGIADSYVFTGNPITPATTVKKGAFVLKNGTDYTVTYTGNTNVGTATVKVTGKGNYSGTLSKTFKITAASLSDCNVSGISSYPYTTKAITPKPTLKYGSVALTASDYTIAYSNNTNVGTATMKITGKGNYTGTVTKTFKITAASIANYTVSGVSASYTYTGKAITPAPTVKNGSVTLKKDTDYTVAYSKNTNAGTATVKITGKGNYTGTITKTFTVKAAQLSGTTVSGISASYTYTPGGVKPAPTVKFGGATLKSGTDYTVAYANNTKAGTATVTLTGKGNFAGTVKKTFKITAVSISKASISNLSATYKYTGKTVTPSIVLKYSGTTLKKDTDYTVSYKNNIDHGTATITITGKGGYTGTVTKTFKIVRQGWYTISGNKYYYNTAGQKTTGLSTISNSEYYFDKSGIMLQGWQKISGKYYFFDRKDGKRIVGKTVDSIAIDKSGNISETAENVARIDTMIRARNVVLEVTDPTDSMETKRLKVFKWIFQFNYHQYRKLNNIYKNPGWEVTFANDIFIFKSGCCVSESAALAFMFHEIGYETVYVAHDTGHAWVEMDGCLYDPLFAEARSFNDNYNVPLAQTDYRKNPVDKRKI